MRKINRLILLVLTAITSTNCSVNAPSQLSGNIDSTSEQTETESVDDIGPIAGNKIDNEEMMTDAKKSEILSYQVIPGDTWMIIAQKLLGDPFKWREIQKLNKKYKKSTELIPGTILSYKAPESMPEQPEGLPYLIKYKDTLQKISNKVYGTKKSWDVIYFNNQDQIQDANLIHRGLVIYYPGVEDIPEVKIKMAEANFNPFKTRKPASK